MYFPCCIGSYTVRCVVTVVFDWKNDIRKHNVLFPVV